MDDLDRMFRRLVQNIRNGYTEYLTKPFEVAELYQNLIPYRHNRREMEIDTNGDYEVALCQLLAGERGFMTGDQAMQEAIRDELGSPNPNTAIFREFAASRVSLSQDALRRYDQMSVDTGAPAAIQAAATPPSPVRRGGAASPAPPARSAPAMSPPASPPPAASHQSPPPPPPAPNRSPVARPLASAASEPRSSPGIERVSAARGSAASTERTPTASLLSPRSAAVAAPVMCRYCGNSLPSDRRVVFCPHCGQNLTVRRCPACNTELDLSWKHCITCGRSMAGA
ncbi:MAG: zinc ribbon domain-containing protein [Gemmatimonadaceae bacterium]